MKTFTVKSEEQGVLVDKAINPENVLYCNTHLSFNGIKMWVNPGRTYILLKGNLAIIAEEPFEEVRAKMDEALRDEPVVIVKDAVKNLRRLLVPRITLLLSKSIQLGKDYTSAGYQELLASSENLFDGMDEALTKKES
jgi:hypothetical protein